MVFRYSPSAVGQPSHLPVLLLIFTLVVHCSAGDLIGVVAYLGPRSHVCAERHVRVNMRYTDTGFEVFDLRMAHERY